LIDQAKKLRELVRDTKSDASRTTTAPAVPGKRGLTTACRSIAVTSGKGGVGKSHTTISLAIALTRLKKKVVVFDGDLGLANVHIMLGIAPKYNLSHVIREECSLSQIICTGPEGITIIPGASGILSMANLGSLQLESLVRELTSLEEAYDFLLIDGGAGIGHAAIQLSSVADTALLIIIPEPASLADAYATAKILFSKGVATIKVLVNMAETDKDGREIYEKLQSLVQNFLEKKISCIGIIPYDKNVSRYIRAQKNIVIERQSSPVALKIQNCARLLCGMQPLRREGFFTRLFTPQLQKGK
jgi:flagellar biosynthesis protein FlhG